MKAKSMENPLRKKELKKPLFSFLFSFLFSSLFSEEIQAKRTAFQEKKTGQTLRLLLAENESKEKDTTKGGAQFQSRKKASSYLQFHVGNTFSKDQAFLWGEVRREKQVARMTAGITYRPKGRRKILDTHLRGDLISFSLQNKRLLKLSLLPLFFTLPSLDSQFPVYVGLGGGLGIFINEQLYDESYFSFDYQFIAGLRLFEVFENIGANFEVAYKNHLFLFNNGGHKALYVSLGVSFRL